MMMKACVVLLRRICLFKLLRFICFLLITILETERVCSYWVIDTGIITVLLGVNNSQTAFHHVVDHVVESALV